MSIRKTGSGTVERFSPDATGSIVDSTGKLWHIDDVSQVDGPIQVGDEVKFNVKGDGIAVQVRKT